MYFSYIAEADSFFPQIYPLISQMRMYYNGPEDLKT